MLSVIICIVTCLCMISAVLFFPKIKIGRFSVASYWVVTLAGSLVLMLTGGAAPDIVFPALIADTAINPIKILVLFISMTVLSIFLDELGFFSYLANVTLKKAGKSQTKLFLLLYITVSVLTVFTSNDIIILSFTPFICYFAKNAGISPMPYLAAEFVAANTWSMALIIGNPTNVYLATASGANFVDYVQVMLLPTLGAGIVAFFALFLLFRRKLSEPIDGHAEEVRLNDKFSLWVGILHLAFATVAMAVGSYIGLEMWLVALFSAVSLVLWSLGIAVFRRRAPITLLKCLRRAPWELVPFILSMFVMIISLDTAGVTSQIAARFGESAPVWKYGLSSFLMSNVINNIPMSVLFSSILEGVSPTIVKGAVYATVVGSNLGACLTPIGALAGIMWSSILREHDLKFGYLDFLKIGVTVAVPSLVCALGILILII